jgi:phosphonate transport system substrate-binding protein
MFRKMVLALGAVLGMATAVPALAQQQELNFGIIATDSVSVQRDRWQPLLDDMQKATGYKINAFFAPDYNGIIEGMRFNKVQVAWFGNKSAMEAVDRASGEVFAQVVYADGTMGYYSLLIVNAASPIKSLDDVLKHPKEYTFGNGDPNSTSGYLVPSYYVFALNHIDPTTHFKAVRAGNHAANMLAVLNKQVDIATNNTEQWDVLQKQQPDKVKELRIVWKSPLIPSDPFVWRKDLPAEMKKKIADFIYNYGKTEREKTVLAKIYNYAGFRPSSNAQLIPIRQLELFKDRQKVEHDAALSDADKKTKLAEIDAKLAALASQAKATN